MLLGFLLSLFLGILMFIWGMRLGGALLQKGATANDLFKGKTLLSLAFLGLYVCLLIIALNVPQMQTLPLEWRFYGMHISWALLRIFLLGACGTAFVVSWHTAKPQVFLVALVGVIGLAGFSGVENYFLSPIHASLHDNLQANGVYKQTSDSSCAPAALATLLQHWGLDASESMIAELAGTSRLGTTMPQLLIAAKALGMDGLELNSSWEEMQQINRPGILAVWLLDRGRKRPHAVALLGLTDSVATIADPAKGQIFYLDRSLFKYVWRKQYVPIFRPTEAYLTPDDAIDALHHLGYLDSPNKNHNLQQAIQKFQADRELSPSGKLDLKTTLHLSGPFLDESPRLDTYPVEANQVEFLPPDY